MKQPITNRTLKSSLKEESVAQFFQRVRNGGARKPLRTIAELADELGMPARRLSALMAINNGPRPVFRTGVGSSSSSSKTWYDPQEVKKWWAEHSA